MAFSEYFMVGAATAAHQVEGNNIHSDYWLQEQLEHSSFVEPSGLACDHYNRYEEDIRLMAKAGLNAYRFSVEWARIEPEEGVFDEAEVEHYRKVIRFCKERGIEPIVTLMHFTSPAWLIRKGGWEAESTIEYFRRYASYVTEKLVSEADREAPKRAHRKAKDPNLARVEADLKEALGTRVNIKYSGKKGKIEIEFFSREELERLIEMLESFGE